MSILKSKDKNEILENFKNSKLTIGDKFLKAVMNEFYDGVKLIYTKYPSYIDNLYDRALEISLVHRCSSDFIFYLLQLPYEIQSYVLLIIISINNEYIDIARYLIEKNKKESLNSYNIYDSMTSPLTAAIYIDNEYLIDYLIFKGADPNHNNSIALQQACILDNFKIVKKLIEEYNVDLSGFTELMIKTLYENKKTKIAKYIQSKKNR